MPDMFDDDWVSPVRPDPEDSRDKIYDLPDVPPTAIRQIPAAVSYDYYEKHTEPGWWQRGEECTGFALAAIANHLIRTEVADDEPSVSPRMMYEMAQEYDGEAYEEGSTLRGALKGWSKLGIASMKIWPYDPDDEHGEIHGSLNLSRVADAGLRPMGPYRRITPHTDIEKMQASLARQTPLFASALLHTGWFRLYLPEADGVIHRHPDDKDKGGHAFVIVGYDERGFWLHNSFGEDWGRAGYGLITYDDWITQGRDVWVPSLGMVAKTTSDAPDPEPAVINGGSAPEEGPVEVRGDGFQRAPTMDAHGDMWPHVVPLDDEGRLATAGSYTVDAKRVKTLFYIFGEQTRSWQTPRLAVIADSGLAVPDVGGRLLEIRNRLMGQEIYPIFLVWNTPWLSSIEREIDKAAPFGMADGSDLGDLFVEVGLPKTNAIHLWRQVVRRAHLAACRSCQPEAGGRIVADSLHYKFRKRPFEIHLVAHGTGDLLLSELAAFLPVPISNASLWAPATSMSEFRARYVPMLEDGCLQHLTVTALNVQSERDDRVGGYGNSPLALISNVLAVPGVDSPELYHFGPEGEAPPAASLAETEAWFMARKPDPEPLLGLETDLRRDEVVRRLRRVGALGVDYLQHRATHRGLLEDDEILARTISRITRTEDTEPLTRPDTEIQVILETPAGDPLMQVVEID